MNDLATTLHRYLKAARAAVMWKVQGLSERDARYPRTPTGTNAAGIVKHLAGVELGYFGLSFQRTMPDTPDWFFATLEGSETGVEVDFTLTRDESVPSVLALYRRVQEFADETITALGADGRGRVPWWPADRSSTTVGTLLVHVTTETNRHAGHLDILREQIDGLAGWSEHTDNLWATRDEAAARYASLVAVAESFASRATSSELPPG